MQKGLAMCVENGISSYEIARDVKVSQNAVCRKQIHWDQLKGR